MQALNTLGSVRWKINTRVLDVIEEIWKDGGRLAQMVDADNVSTRTSFRILHGAITVNIPYALFECS